MKAPEITVISTRQDRADTEAKAERERADDERRPRAERELSEQHPRGAHGGGGHQMPGPSAQ
jgi:hypothetical protein